MYNKKLINSLNKDIKNHFSNIFEIKKDYEEKVFNISRLVMLDRYSQKDTHLITLKKGDLVLVITKSHPKFPTRGIGYVASINEKSKSAKIKLESEYLQALNKDELDKNSLLEVKLNAIDKPLEIYWDQIAQRVASNLGSIEKNEVDRKKWTKVFFSQIGDLKILPAGRVLYGAGSNSSVTYFNCYVMPYIVDSRTGISKHREIVMEIMSRGGGVGTNGSTLRPRNAVAKSVGGKSSGSVSWLHDLSNLTDLVQQGGSRRGAQMIMLADWHPDIIEFIISKMQKPEILLWLKNNSNDPLVRKTASNKLELKPLTEDEKESCDFITKNPKLFSEQSLDIAKKKLEQQGTWAIVNPDYLSGANISVCLSDDFMQAVQENKDWNLRFPDIENYSSDEKDWYDQNWSKYGDIREWEELGFRSRNYYTMKAMDLWDLINFCANYSAEPGVFYIDVANRDTNAKSYQQKVVATNPCGEQPLAPFSVCNLAAINLSKFVNRQTGEILFDEIKNSTRVCVRLQDNVIDATPYFLEENKKQALGERRVGLGIMGLHDLLIWAGYQYGSKRSIKLIDKLFRLISTTAYEESIDLAKEKGSFPFLQNRDLFVKTGYVSKLPSHIKMNILRFGIRNSHLLTIAPTGTTGTLANVSTGLEPYFGYVYYRSGRLGKSIVVESDIVKQYKKIHPNLTEKEYDRIFVKASDLTPKQHVNVQVAIQKWIDSSISKTVNAPKGYTVKQVEDIYMTLYKGKAKGGTVYVDGSRNAQVLSLTDETKTKKETKSKVSNIVVDDFNKHIISEIKDKQEEKKYRGVRQDRKLGVELGDICPNCKEGIVVERGGCSECSNCNAQLKCGL